MQQTKEAIDRLRALMLSLAEDLGKSYAGNRAASRRARVATVILEKEFKKFRKVSADEMPITKKA